MTAWASEYISKLKKGETVKFRPFGKSMEGKISSGQLCTVEPIPDKSQLKPGNIVLCTVKSNQYLHLIKDISKNGKILIGNNKGYNNGWIFDCYIWGICTNIED